MAAGLSLHSSMYIYMTTLNSDCKLVWTWLAVYFLIWRALLLYGSMGKENYGNMNVKKCLIEGWFINK